jgi:3',5'-cyclic AMP phosphodiesterase CpdA
VGLPSQFEALAEVLADARIDPDRITLVPGNHDAYAAPGAWNAALAGPLAPYRACAAERAGKVVDRGAVAILPLDVSIHQPLGLAAGALSDADAAAIERCLGGLRDRTVVIALHHHPFPHASRAWQWIDGLRGCERLMAALAEHPNVHVLHGHLHYAVERAVRGRTCIHGATATVEDPIGAPRIRVYELETIAAERAAA